MRKRERGGGGGRERIRETRSRSSSRYLAWPTKEHNSRGWGSHLNCFSNTFKRVVAFFDTVSSNMLSIFYKFEILLILSVKFILWSRYFLTG